MAKNPQDFIENPFNAFFLVKSLSFDFNEFQKALNDTVADFSNSTKDLKLPLTDFAGAIDGFLRIQETYELKSEDLVAGIIDGEKFHEEFAVEDILVLGLGLMKFNTNYGEDYLKIALNKSTDDKLNAKILRKLFEIHANSKNYQEALKVLALRIELDPDNEELKKLQINLELIALFNEDKEIEEVDDPLAGTHNTEEKNAKIFSQSCRGLRTQSIAEISKLFCRFHSTNFFSKIAPFKLEVANENPFVGIFHDVISEVEIEDFKKIARPHLHRAQVMDENSTSIVSNDRVAKLSFLYEQMDKVLDRVHRRVGDMTGLNMKTG